MLIPFIRVPHQALTVPASEKLPGEGSDHGTLHPAGAMAVDALGLGKILFALSEGLWRRYRPQQQPCMCLNH